MFRYTLFLLGIFFSNCYAQNNGPTIVLHTNDAVVWHPQQEINGQISGFSGEELIAHIDEDTFPVQYQEDGTFSFQCNLPETVNKIWIETGKAPAVTSDTIVYTLGYGLRPSLLPFVTINQNKALLQFKELKNPTSAPLHFIWKASQENPATTDIRKVNDSISSVHIPATDGTYFFDLYAIAEKDTTKFRTMATKKGNSVYANDVYTEYPIWMDGAVIYQITPHSFVENGTFADITAKLNEIKELGANTLLLQPIYETALGDQGYDVTGYTSINPKFGTEEDLRQLIGKAKELGMRTLFDMVINHSSIQHPYATDRIENGKNSHYYDFYQHQDDGKPYASFYNQDEHGFINYFWDNLVNLNYDNKEVQRWILEVCKYWVREFDIDGYRFDAIWGVNARKPSFAQKLRTELKSIKPDILLIAEDKGAVPEVYKLGYDAAYDWTANMSWVSQWSWEYEYDERRTKTLFNHPDVDQRGPLLKKALFQNGGNNHRKLFYLQNNDLPGFIRDHGTEKTKMAAALLFSLPGIPLLYNGQEIGHSGHPYSTDAFFKRDETVRSLDGEGLFGHYQNLIELHKSYGALSGTQMAPLNASPEGPIVSFHRWEGSQNFIIAVNLSDSTIEAKVALSEPLKKMYLPGKDALRDVLTGQTFPLKKNISELSVPMKGNSVRWLLLAK
ncbi:MAG: alpha-amylase family glycosyl hydrolase [Sediminicola sp.]